MGALPTTGLMTVADFEVLAEQSRSRLELIDGVVREKPVANARHRQIQYNLYDILKSNLKPGYRAAMELEFRPTTDESSLPRVDVAAVSITRFEEATVAGYLVGAPELVIEVVSRSNAATDLNGRRRLCLRGGCQEFWLVYPDDWSVQVWTPDAVGRDFNEADQIRSSLFGTDKVPVSQIFA